VVRLELVITIGDDPSSVAGVAGNGEAAVASDQGPRHLCFNPRKTRREMARTLVARSK
jgi:hypothetical protein